MPNPVKCRDCGYLAKHAVSARAGAYRYYEIDIADRNSPRAFFSHVVDALNEVPTDLVCFMHKADLMEECEGQEAFALMAIAKDRECESFYAHMPGFDPKEHLESYKMQRLEQDRREFEERLAKRDHEVHTALITTQQVFDLEREKTQQAFQLERDRSQEPTNRLMKRVTIIAAILGAIQVAIGLAPDSLIVQAVVKLWRLIFG